MRFSFALPPRAAVTILLMLGLSLPAPAQTLYVDPVLGVDVPGGGSSAVPLRTVSFAVTQGVGGGALLDLRLAAGTYSDQSGEFFPIPLPPRCSLTSATPLGARFAVSGPLVAPIFDVLGGSQAITLDGVRLDTFGRGVRVVLGAADQLQLDLVDCAFSASRAVTVDVDSGQAAVRVRRSRLAAGDKAVQVIARGAGHVDLLLDRCAVSLADRGVELRAEGVTSTIAARLEQTSVARCGSTGIWASAYPGCAVTSEVVSSVFHRNGAATGGPLAGAIRDVGGTVTHALANTVFLDNVHDLPTWSAAAYAIASCRFGEPALCALPGAGNLCADPLFVDADGGDFHVDPGSPMVDAGAVVAGAPTADVDGDPRPGHPSLGGPALPDIGLDEAYSAHLRAVPEPAVLGQLVRFRLFGPSGSNAFLLISTSDNGQPFGPTLRLALPLLLDPLPLGTLAATSTGAGFLEVAVPVPDQPVLLGLVLREQAAFASGMGVTFGFDVWTQRFREF